MSELWNTSNPSDFYKKYSIAVEYSNPRLGRTDAEESLRRWIKKGYWPAEIGPEELAKGMQCVHVPYFIVNAQITFRWEAVVATSRSYTETYTDSTGQRQTRTRWYTESNLEKGVAVDHVVLDGIIDATRGEMKCGDPDLVVALKKGEILNKESNVRVMPAKTRTAEDVASRLQELEGVVRKAAKRDVTTKLEAKSSGSVRSMEIESLRYKWRRNGVHLYPVWLSSFSYRDRVYTVEIDAHTGNVYVQIPGSVRVKRTLVTGCGCFLLLVLGGFIFALLYWLRSLGY